MDSRQPVRSPVWKSFISTSEASLRAGMSVTGERIRDKIAASKAKGMWMGDRYVARFLNLTTLAPEIVAAILDETLPEDVTLGELSLNPAVVWEAQRRSMGVAG